MADYPAAMSQTVTVAVLGNVDHAFENGAFDWTEHGARQFELPYEELPKVTLEVAEDETLGSALARAAKELDVPVPEWHESLEQAIGFYAFRLADEPPQLRQEITLVDDDGRAIWSVPFKDAEYGRLQRAADAGVLRGNPREPYLVLLGPQGNGVLPSWAALIEGLHILLRVLEAFAAVEGTRAFAATVVQVARERLGAGREAVQTHYIDWDARGARPDNFAELLARGPWAGPDLAERLSCSTEEAEAILWAYGYTRTESGLWRRDGDDPARLLHAALEDLDLTFHWNPGGGFERIFKRRAEAFLATGEPPPEPRPEPEKYEDSPLPDGPSEIGPIEGLCLACECGQEGCKVEISFYRGGPDLDRVVLRFSEPTDHFTVDPAMLGALLGTLAR